MINVSPSTGTLTFVREFAREPMSVASLIPSGRTLSRRVSVGVPAAGDPVVVELGPGTGAFTGIIQESLAGRGHHIAVDVNERFTALLAGRFPAVDVVTADAGRLPQLLADRGHPHADVVVSGLPWAAFRRPTQQHLLDAVVAALPPTGVFTTFAYVHARWAPPARRLRRSLEERFEEVVLGRTVWSNLPPALVYHCRRPIHAAA